MTPVLDGGGGKNSIFARGLLEVLNSLSGNFAATSLFERLQKVVMADAMAIGHEQVPTYAALNEAGHIGPDFVFYAN